MRARLPISASRLSSPLAPAATPITHDPPAGRRAPAGSRRGWARRPARGSRRTGPARRSPRARSPRRRARRPLAQLARRARSRSTRAPAARPSWIAAVPTPPAPPCTSRRSPGRSSAWVKSASWAVVKTSGRPPAAGQSSAAGHRHQLALVHDVRAPPGRRRRRSPSRGRRPRSASPPGPSAAHLARELHPGDVLRRARAAPGRARAAASCRRR